VTLIGLPLAGWGTEWVSELWHLPLFTHLEVPLSSSLYLKGKVKLESAKNDTNDQSTIK
jgi:hypothetical protein